MSNLTCSIHECTRPHYGKSLCNMHYQRLRKTGTTEARQKQIKYCSVSECEKPLTPPHGRGMCSLHYGRWQNHGDPLYVRQPVTGIAVCSVSSCEKLVIARGWCAAHWTRWKRYGDPLARMQGEVVNGKRICPTCGVDKVLDSFFAGGRGGPCKQCAPEYARQWRRDNPLRVREGSHRRRAQIRQAYVEKVEIAILIQRDGGLCRLCATPVDTASTFPDPFFPTIDHVIPLFHGGEHSYANTQLAHYLCNVRKGARMPA